MQYSVTNLFTNTCDILSQSAKWEKYRKDANEQVMELSEVFAGSRPLARVAKNDRLHKWFKDIADQILSLNLDEPAAAGRKIIQLIQAMKEVKGKLCILHGLSVYDIALTQHLGNWLNFTQVGWYLYVWIIL